MKIDKTMTIVYKISRNSIDNKSWFDSVVTKRISILHEFV